MYPVSGGLVVEVILVMQVDAVMQRPCAASERGEAQCQSLFQVPLLPFWGLVFGLCLVISTSA